MPYVMNYYRNTLVCYSYSKSLSLPGERIGYIAVCPDAENEGDLYAAICGAGRSLGFVCAPSLFQQLVARCVDKTADIEIYRKNRDMLCEALTKYGYRCIKPDGAFYLFIEALEPDSIAFCEKQSSSNCFWCLPIRSVARDSYVFRTAYVPSKFKRLCPHSKHWLSHTENKI